MLPMILFTASFVALVMHVLHLVPEKIERDLCWKGEDMGILAGKLFLLALGSIPISILLPFL